MSRCKEKDGADVLASGRKSGRAVFDEYGRSTWEWQTSTGVFERHITDEQLHALATPALQLVEADEPRKYEGLWVHDSHRPARTPPPRRTATNGDRVVRTSFWRRLWSS